MGGVLIVILSSVIIHNNILNKTYKVGSSGAIGTFTYNRLELMKPNMIIMVN